MKNNRTKWKLVSPTKNDRFNSSILHMFAHYINPVHTFALLNFSPMHKYLQPTYQVKYQIKIKTCCCCSISLTGKCLNIFVSSIVFAVFVILNEQRCHLNFASILISCGVERISIFLQTQFHRKESDIEKGKHVTQGEGGGSHILYERIA